MTKQQAIEDKLKTIERLQQDLAEVRAQQMSPSEAQRVLADMLQAGFVERDANGEWQAGPGSPA